MSRTVRSVIDKLVVKTEQREPLEFCRFYVETRNYLLQYAEQVNSSFISRKTQSLAKLIPTEFRSPANHGLINWMVSRKIRSMRVNEKLELKLEQISNDLQAILEVIENPELEIMYNNAILK